jgi:hypothetical protein
MIAVYIAAGVIVAGIISWLLLRKTVRTRLRVEKMLRDDPDINDYLVIFDWSRKVLYVPSIIAAAAAAMLMVLQENIKVFSGINPGLIGGLFLGVIFVNLMVEEYRISVKVLIIVVISIGFLLLWLHLLGWVLPFLRLFKGLACSVSSTGYILITLIGLFTIFLSWIKGLFFYVTITPNYVNLQEGPTESGEHIGREDYNTVVDTADFLERLMGFGRIIIIFKDMKRPPVALLVWPIQKKAQMLESVRGKFAIDLDHHQAQNQQQNDSQSEKNQQQN